MKVIRQYAKLASVFLAILMLFITFPFDSVLAAMIETEATLGLKRAQQARDEINQLLLRQEVQDALMAQGIDPLEAKARIDSLSDAEAIRIADEIDKLPVGAKSMQIIPDWLGVLIIVGFLAILVLIVTGLVYLGKHIDKKSDSADSEKSDSPEQQNKPADKPIAAFSPTKVDPTAPWTGVWDVQGSVHFSGRWRMTQTGSTVSSTKDSVYEIKGKAKGNQLKGKISSSTSSSQFNSFVINISPDGLSFEGTCDLSWQKNLPVKGRREQ